MTVSGDLRRVLLTWEMGLNLGHLASIQPLAKRLLAQGCQVLVAARQVDNAAELLGKHGIPYVQAPSLPRPRQMLSSIAGYADILYFDGWGDGAALSWKINAWMKLFDAFRPDLVVLDHSPTAYLAARIGGIPAVAVGNGFELPPLSKPLPPFPGLSWATAAAAEHSELRVLAGVNQVLKGFGAPTCDSLASVFCEQQRILTTVPELDHYMPRSDAHYSGPLLAWTGVERVDWPHGNRKRVFAYLRKASCDVEVVLQALALSGVSAICFVPESDTGLLQSRAGPRIRVVSKPVDLEFLVKTSDACVVYSAVGTAHRFLFAGVPLLLMPRTVEAQMGARKIEQLGAGVVVRGKLPATTLAMLVQRVVGQDRYRLCARAFAQRYAQLSLPDVADDITRILLSRLPAKHQLPV